MTLLSRFRVFAILAVLAFAVAAPAGASNGHGHKSHGHGHKSITKHGSSGKAGAPGQACKGLKVKGKKTAEQRAAFKTCIKDAVARRKTDHAAAKGHAKAQKDNEAEDVAGDDEADDDAADDSDDDQADDDAADDDSDDDAADDEGDDD